MAHTLLDRPECAEVTEATRVAAFNFNANRGALAASQPWLADALPTAEDLTWIFGRDGYLTAMGPGETWHTGCSVPLMAARTVLKTLDPGTGSVCFLNPQHAGQVCAAFEHLQPNQALICIIGDGVTNVATLLHCDDFSLQIERGRLWLACGDDWAGQLARIFDEQPGLPVPSRFVRLPKVDQGALERAIADAQRVFSDCTASRTAAIAATRSNWNRREAPAGKPRVCLVAKSMFRLWDDAGETLYRTVAGSSDAAWTRFDPDAPAGCSPLALAKALGESDAAVAADLSRADLPAGLAPAELPWVTWVTSGRISAFTTAGPHDALLLANAGWAKAAADAGWPADRVQTAGWPTNGAASSPPQAAPPSLAIIADTCAIEPPESVTEYSSQTLLWEKIQQFINRDPLVVPADPAEWVGKLASNAGIDLRSLDVPLFVQRLVVPAYSQAIAEILINADIPIRIYGEGWTALPRFSDHAAGPVTSREELAAIVQGASAVVHVWPPGVSHPIDALGRPVLRRSGTRREAFLRDARLALAAGSPFTPAPPAQTLSAAAVLAVCVGTSRAR